ncbi:hypothetical protein, partial [Enterobacter asburiae]|uniref:hypothetical protein n=1 Tax=Enterobacter asburiae TaxID=61645 RepID=UPI001F4B3952
GGADGVWGVGAVAAGYGVVFCPHRKPIKPLLPYKISDLVISISSLKWQAKATAIVKGTT